MIDRLIKHFKEINSVDAHSTRFLKWLKEIKEDDKRIVGNKAYYQSVLLKNHYLVPNGFVILPEAFKYFLKQNGIYEKIVNLLELLKQDPDEERIEKTANEIQKSIYYSYFPESLKNELLENFGYLNFRDVSAENLLNNEKIEVTVRLSIDLPIEKPFHLTFLKLSKRDFLDSIKTIWAALFLKKNITMHLKNIEKLFNPSILVEEFIEHKRSGIVDVESDYAIIYLAKGYGIYFSSKDTKPEIYKIRLSDYKILDHIANDQNFYYTYDPLEEKIVKVEGEIKEIVFNEQEVREIGYFAKRVCLDFNKYAKIDFIVSDDDKIYITTLTLKPDVFDKEKLNNYQILEESKKINNESKKDTSNQNSDELNSQHNLFDDDVDYLYEEYVNYDDKKSEIQTSNETHKKEISDSETKESNENIESIKKDTSLISTAKKKSNELMIKKVFLKIFNKYQEKMDLTKFKILVENIDKVNVDDVIVALYEITSKI